MGIVGDRVTGENDMRINEPWTCDICQAKKQPSNGWCIGFANKRFDFEANGIKVTTTATAILPWNDLLADRKGAVHLCGVECISKFVAKAIAKGSGR
jgi:ferredoxin